MDTVRGYLLSITVVALCCGILCSILGKKGLTGSTVKFLCGIVMLLTVVGPLLNIRIGDIKNSFVGISQEGKSIAALGQESALKEYMDNIKERTAAYILDKAENLGAELTVEVTLSDDDLLVPCAVKLSGTVSPYAKRVLKETIARDLGIQEGEQTWIG